MHALLQRSLLKVSRFGELTKVPHLEVALLLVVAVEGSKDQEALAAEVQDSVVKEELVCEVAVVEDEVLQVVGAGEAVGRKVRKVVFARNSSRRKAQNSQCQRKK